MDGEPEVSSNPQLDEDQEFLASLMDKIEPEEVPVQEVKEEDVEEKEAVVDPMADFDEDDIMFSN